MIIFNGKTKKNKSIQVGNIIMQSGKNSNEFCWNPIKIFECPPDYKFALVILNRPILLKHDLVLSMWEKAQVTVTVDGGTNKWMDYLGDLEKDVFSGKSKKYLPNLVTGDMDSISPALLERLKLTEACVIHTPDQMETDYTKAMRQLNEYIVKNKKGLDGIHVIVENSGRLDQIVSNINTLYKCDKIFDNVPVMHVDSASLTWLLNPGTHKIIIPDVILKSKSHCALIPFDGATNCVTTTGLKWNLNNTCMKFGGLVSTSNTYSDKEVCISTSVQIVWSMGIEAVTGGDKKNKSHS